VPSKCTNCGRDVDRTVRHTVDRGRVVRCERCPKPTRTYRLSETDRRLLKEMRIKVD
jgi:hypothetical protein